MKRALSLEWLKVKGQKNLLIIAVLLVLETLWIYWSTRKTVSQPDQEWLEVLFQFSILNALFMAFIAMLLAIRISDLEHKGNALRLMRTIIPVGRLFAAKAMLGGLFVLVSVALQAALIVAMQWVKGLLPESGMWMLGRYSLTTYLASFTVFIVLLVVALYQTNMVIPLGLGLLGCFFGLASMLFPVVVQRLVVWGYYGVLIPATFHMGQAATKTDYYVLPVDWLGHALLIGQLFVFLGAGYLLLKRKED